MNEQGRQNAIDALLSSLLYTTDVKYQLCKSEIQDFKSI